MAKKTKTPEQEIAEFQAIAKAAKESENTIEPESTLTETPNIDNSQVESKPVSNIKADEILLPNGQKIKILPTRIKYLKNGFFQGYKIIESIGTVDLLRYSDGEEVIINFLISVLDGNESLVKSIFEELSLEDISNIIKISKKVNGIKEENFNLAPMGME